LSSDEEEEFNFREPDFIIKKPEATRKYLPPAALSATAQSRVRWTDDEISFVGQWCSETLARNPENQNNIVARCLAYIRAHEDIAAIFHPNHILSSGRLKHGLESYNKRTV
jgi:hypothetical protein